jgi:hypothetical protein
MDRTPGMPKLTQCCECGWEQESSVMIHWKEDYTGRKYPVCLECWERISGIVDEIKNKRMENYT